MTLAHFVTVFAVNELRIAVLRSLGVAAISALDLAARDHVVMAHAMHEEPHRDQ